MFVSMGIELALLGALPNFLSTESASWLNPRFSRPQVEVKDTTTHVPSLKPQIYETKPKPIPTIEREFSHPTRPSVQPSTAPGKTLTPSPPKSGPVKHKPFPIARAPWHPRARKPSPPRTGLSLEYLMMGATTRPQTSEVYMDPRIEKIGRRWGWNSRCMPGFGRSAISLPSVYFRNFSTEINDSSIPYKIGDYRFIGTVFSNASGEHQRIGIDVGLSVWSCIPIQHSSTGDLTHIAFLATPPVRERDQLMLSKLKRDQTGNNTFSSLPDKDISRNFDESINSNFECVVYAHGEQIKIPATKTVSTSKEIVSISCPIASIPVPVQVKLVSQDDDGIILALHDMDLNLFWNFSKPCLPVTLDSTTGTSEGQIIASSASYWSSIRVPKRRALTAVLIVRNETSCFLVEWLESMIVLGFDHVYVYKQQALNGVVDHADRLLLKYVRKDFVTVVPFFNSQYRCDESTSLDSSKCQVFNVGYKILFQDALWRFPSNWTVLADANEMLILPRLQTSSSNGTLSIDSPENIKLSILQALGTASKSVGVHTKQFMLSQVSFGTGPRRNPQPFCPSTCTSIMGGMQWRAEYDLPSDRRFVMDGAFPYAVHAPSASSTTLSQDNLDRLTVGRIHSSNMKLHRYLRAYQGALSPEHNQIADHSTQAYSRFLADRTSTSRLESCH